MNGYEKTIVFSLIISSFTLLRFGIMGFGEVALLLLFFSTIKLSLTRTELLKHEFSFTRFWGVFICCTIVGFMYNYFSLGFVSSTLASVVFDFGAYMFIFLSLIAIQSLLVRNKIDAYSILKYTFLYGGAILSILFVMSLFSSQIFNLSLKSGPHFAPLVENLHQISMLIAPMTLVGFIVLQHEKKKRVRNLVFLLIFMFIIMSFSSGSFKAYVGVVLGLLFVAISSVFEWFRRKTKLNLWVISIFFAMILSLAFWNQLTDILWRIFEEEDTNQGRTTLTVILKPWKERSTSVDQVMRDTRNEFYIDRRCL